MPLFALLIDLLLLGSYFLQLTQGNRALYFFGILLQGAMTVILLIFAFAYRGKHYTNYRPQGYSYTTLRYGIIVISLIINAIVLFLYFLNITGRNDIIFSGF